MTETRHASEPRGTSLVRQWSKTAFNMALLFASLPVIGRVALGAWEFQEAYGISILCLAAAGYLRMRERRLLAIPDPATHLDHAIRLAMAGELADAVDLLTNTIRQNSRLWQAFQYRGEIYLRQPGTAEAALQDFNEAIRVAPGEAHLYVLRSLAYRLLGSNEAAASDEQAAVALGYKPPVPETPAQPEAAPAPPPE